MHQMCSCLQAGPPAGTPTSCVLDEESAGWPAATNIAEAAQELTCTIIQKVAYQHQPWYTFCIPAGSIYIMPLHTL